MDYIKFSQNLNKLLKEKNLSLPTALPQTPVQPVAQTKEPNIVQIAGAGFWQSLTKKAVATLQGLKAWIYGRTESGLEQGAKMVAQGTKEATTPSIAGGEVFTELSGVSPEIFSFTPEQVKDTFKEVETLKTGLETKRLTAASAANTEMQKLSAEKAKYTNTKLESIVWDIMGAAGDTVLSMGTLAATTALGQPYLGLVAIGLTSGAQELAMSYLDILGKGVDEKTAANVSLVVGAINGTIEVAGGEMVLNALVTPTTTKIGNKIVNTLVDKGLMSVAKISAIAGKTVGDIVFSGVSEGLEEILQGYTSDIGQGIAMKENVKNILDDMYKNTPEHFYEFFIASTWGAGDVAMVNTFNGGTRQQITGAYNDFVDTLVDKATKNFNIKNTEEITQQVKQFMAIYNRETQKGIADLIKKDKNVVNFLIDKKELSDLATFVKDFNETVKVSPNPDITVALSKYFDSYTQKVQKEINIVKDYIAPANNQLRPQLYTVGINKLTDVVSRVQILQSLPLNDLQTQIVKDLSLQTADIVKTIQANRQLVLDNPQAAKATRAFLDAFERANLSRYVNKATGMPKVFSALNDLNLQYPNEINNPNIESSPKKVSIRNMQKRLNNLLAVVSFINGKLIKISNINTTTTNMNEYTQQLNDTIQFIIDRTKEAAKKQGIDVNNAIAKALLERSGIVIPTETKDYVALLLQNQATVENAINNFFSQPQNAKAVKGKAAQQTQEIVQSVITQGQAGMPQGVIIKEEGAEAKVGQAGVPPVVEAKEEVKPAEVQQQEVLSQEKEVQIFKDTLKTYTPEVRTYVKDTIEFFIGDNVTTEELHQINLALARAAEIAKQYGRDTVNTNDITLAFKEYKLLSETKKKKEEIALRQKQEEEEARQQQEAAKQPEEEIVNEFMAGDEVMDKDGRRFEITQKGWSADINGIYYVLKNLQDNSTIRITQEEIEKNYRPVLKTSQPAPQQQEAVKKKEVAPAAQSVQPVAQQVEQVEQVKQEQQVKEKKPKNILTKSEQRFANPEYWSQITELAIPENINKIAEIIEAANVFIKKYGDKYGVNPLVKVYLDQMYANGDLKETIIELNKNDPTALDIKLQAVAEEALKVVDGLQNKTHTPIFNYMEQVEQQNAEAQQQPEENQRVEPLQENKQKVNQKNIKENIPLDITDRGQKIVISLEGIERALNNIQGNIKPYYEDNMLVTTPPQSIVPVGRPFMNHSSVALVFYDKLLATVNMGQFGLYKDPPAFSQILTGIVSKNPKLFTNFNSAAIYIERVGDTSYYNFYYAEEVPASKLVRQTALEQSAAAAAADKGRYTQLQRMVEFVNNSDKYGMYLFSTEPDYMYGELLKPVEQVIKGELTVPPYTESEFFINWGALSLGGKNQKIVSDFNKAIATRLKDYMDAISKYDNEKADAIIAETQAYLNNLYDSDIAEELSDTPLGSRMLANKHNMDGVRYLLNQLSLTVWMKQYNSQLRSRLNTLYKDIHSQVEELRKKWEQEHNIAEGTPRDEENPTPEELAEIERQAEDKTKDIDDKDILKFDLEGTALDSNNQDPRIMEGLNLIYGKMDYKDAPQDVQQLYIDLTQKNKTQTQLLANDDVMRIAGIYNKLVKHVKDYLFALHMLRSQQTKIVIDSTMENKTIFEILAQLGRTETKYQSPVEITPEIIDILNNLLNKNMKDLIQINPNFPLWATNVIEKMKTQGSALGLTPRELRILRRIFDPHLKIQTEELTAPTNWLTEASSVIALLKSWVTGIDLSATFRHLGFEGVSHPVLLFQSLEKGIQGLNADTAAEILANLYNDPEVRIGIAAGLQIGVPEMYQDLHNGRIVGFIEKTPIVNIFSKIADKSELLFTTEIAWFRANLFKTFYDILSSANPEITNNVAAMQALAGFVNIGTGTLGGAKTIINKEMLDMARLVMWAPQFTFSRTVLLNPKYYFDMLKNPATRPIGELAMKEFFKAFLLVFGAIFLAKKAGAYVEDDFTSADFGKARIGNQHIDLTLGFAPYIRLVGSLLSDHLTSTTTLMPNFYGTDFGQITKEDVILNFFQGKSDLVLSFFADIMSGTDFAGRQIQFGLSSQGSKWDAIESNVILRRLIPMSVADVIDATVYEGNPAAVMRSMLSILGINTQTYLPLREKDLPEYYKTIEEHPELKEKKLNALALQRAVNAYNTQLRYIKEMPKEKQAKALQLLKTRLEVAKSFYGGAGK
jgi:hypothetical protein